MVAQIKKVLPACENQLPPAKNLNATPKVTIIVLFGQVQNKSKNKNKTNQGCLLQSTVNTAEK